MPPAFRINILLAEKALAESKTKAAINKDLAEYLGISTRRLQLLRRAKSDQVISADMLVRIADFFQCDIDDVINPALKQAAQI